ncbi:MAG: hypothetical protein RMI30_03280 [Thermodesulfovibrio sp.]|nr:hypothetical protein [Thermodesulfovibrio sp.]
MTRKRMERILERCGIDNYTFQGNIIILYYYRDLNKLLKYMKKRTKIVETIEGIRLNGYLLKVDVRGENERKV